MLANFIMIWQCLAPGVCTSIGEVRDSMAIKGLREYKSGNY